MKQMRNRSTLLTPPGGLISTTGFCSTMPMLFFLLIGTSNASSEEEVSEAVRATK